MNPNDLIPPHGSISNNLNSHDNTHEVWANRNPQLVLGCAVQPFFEENIVWLGKGPATRNDIVDDFVTMRALNSIFATLNSIVDDIVTCGMALSRIVSNLIKPVLAIPFGLLISAIYSCCTEYK